MTVRPSGSDFIESYKWPPWQFQWEFQNGQIRRRRLRNWPNISLKNSEGEGWRFSFTDGQTFKSMESIKRRWFLWGGQQPIEFTVSLSTLQVNEYVKRQENKYQSHSDSDWPTCKKDSTSLQNNKPHAHIAWTLNMVEEHCDMPRAWRRSPPSVSPASAFCIFMTQSVPFCVEIFIE